MTFLLRGSILLVRPQLVTLVISPANLPSCHLTRVDLPGIYPISLDHLRRPTRPTRSVDGLTFIHLPALVGCYKYSFFTRTCYWLEHTAICYPISFICQLLSQLCTEWCSPDTLARRHVRHDTGSKGCAHIAGHYRRTEESRHCRQTIHTSHYWIMIKAVDKSLFKTYSRAMIHAEEWFWRKGAGQRHIRKGWSRCNIMAAVCAKNVRTAGPGRGGRPLPQASRRPTTPS